MQQQQQKTNKIPKSNKKKTSSSLHLPRQSKSHDNNNNNNINISNSPSSVSTSTTISTQLKRGRRPSLITNGGVSLSPQIRPGSRSRVVMNNSSHLSRGGDVGSVGSGGNGQDFQRRPPTRTRSGGSGGNGQDFQRRPPTRTGSGGSGGNGQDFQRRPPTRARSMDPASRAISNSPASRDGGGGGGRGSDFQRRPPVRVRSMDPASRAISNSPASRDGGGGGGRGRGSDFQRRPLVRVRSMDPASIQRGQHQQQNQQRQQQSHNNQNRARSMSPSRMRRARSMSPSRMQRSPSTAGGSHSRGRSIDRSGGGDGLNRGRSIDRSVGSSDGIIKKKEYPRQTLHPLQKQKFASSRRLVRSFRRGISKRQLGFTWCQLTQYIIPIVILIGASIGLIFATGNGSIVTDILIPKIENSEMEDPYSNDGEAPHWPADGNGLRATIINALNDDWQTTFALAITDWNFGLPNAVDIVEEIGTYTPNCEAPDGKIIVCNGDYGETKWRGINEAILDASGEIVSTAARMNTYYLSNMDSGAWQYTMCHELGHTLGLGHTDEDFNNADLGNCMDYTNRLDANKHPDTMNYMSLLLLYGPISGRRRRHHRQLQKDTRYHDGAITVASTSTSTRPSGRVSGLRLRRGSNNNNNNKNIRLRDEVDSSSSDDDDTAVGVFSTIPDHIRKKKREVVKELLDKRRDDDENINNNFHDRDGWKLVHRKLHGEEYEIFLGEGYKVRVQLLLV